MKNSQANEPSLAVTMWAGNFVPLGPVAKKLLAVSEVGSTGREKNTCGRKVVPTSSAPSRGVNERMPNAMAVGRLTLRLTLVSCPAASRAVTESVCGPAARRDKSSDWSKRPVAGSNAIGITVPASSWYVSRVIGEPVPSAQSGEQRRGIHVAGIDRRVDGDRRRAGIEREGERLQRRDIAGRIGAAQSQHVRRVGRAVQRQRGGQREVARRVEGQLGKRPVVELHARAWSRPRDCPTRGLSP